MSYKFTDITDINENLARNATAQVKTHGSRRRIIATLEYVFKMKGERDLGRRPEGLEIGAWNQIEIRPVSVISELS